MCCSMDIVIAIKSKQTFEDSKTDSNWMALTAWWQLNLSSRCCISPFIMFYFRFPFYAVIFRRHVLQAEVSAFFSISDHLRDLSDRITADTAQKKKKKNICRRAWSLCIKSNRENFNKAFQPLWFPLSLPSDWNEITGLRRMYHPE